MKNWPAFLILFAGFLGAFASFVSSRRNDKQQTAIQTTGELNTKLAENIQTVTGNINQLQALNHDVTLNVQSLAKQNIELSKTNQELTQRNIVLTDKTRALIEDVDTLTNKVNVLLRKVHDEVTGGEAVPVITAELYYNDFDKYIHNQPNQYEWLLRFYIQNPGDHAVKNIGLKKYDDYYRRYDVIDLPTVENLYPKDIKPIFEILARDAKDRDEIHIDVTWKVRYSLAVWIKQRKDASPTPPMKGMYTIQFRYSYKNSSFTNKEDLVAAIRADLKAGE